MGNATIKRGPFACVGHELMGTVDRVCEICPLDLALPVVFVPGIMGSRLKQTNSGLNVWDPVTRSFLWQYAGAGPGARRRLVIGNPGSFFDPNFLTVDFADAEWMSDHVPENVAQEKVDRGWGGLVWDFYGPFVQWMERDMPRVLTNDDPRMGGLKVEAFAEPYNWAGDNGASAEGLNRRVSQAMSETAAKYAGTETCVLKPIVVTHSMGGLVARAFAKDQPNAGQVSAIIHGALPTQGAPAAYKRMMAGFEGGASVALGVTGSQVVAIGANSPGVLELLPSTFHKNRNGNKKWLRFTLEGAPVLELPQSDPYSEIYAREDVWWRPVQIDEIDPETPDPLEQEAAWTSYLSNLELAKNFHGGLGESAGGFHPNTYMLYSDSSAFLSWDEVEWRGEMPQRTELGVEEDVTIWGINTGIDSRSAETTDDPSLLPQMATAMTSAYQQASWDVSLGDGSPLGAILDLGSTESADGTGTRLRGTAAMQGVNAAGDGTVHGGSGIQVPGSIENEPTKTADGGLAGYSHDQCYNSDQARLQAAQWILEEIQAQI
ncbi:hypothetical protein MWU61_17920 [Loktanella sp. F6476L]|uniref:esterase/lipase family protein n=1 Tax=Loktanella sp. F6476L TaxID=2926405 RepID=UPI001FF33304|nr:hypothetical protein [Loktanella sp. F6476L]MCK0122438.1 hypothetical protein [Loktanella sp. F6476L]